MQNNASHSFIRILGGLTAVLVFSTISAHSQVNGPLVLVDEGFSACVEAEIKPEVTAVDIPPTDVFFINQSGSMWIRNRGSSAVNSRAIYVGNGAVFGTTNLIAIPKTSHFRMLGGIDFDGNKTTSNSGGALGCGWSSSEYNFEYYAGTGADSGAPGDGVVSRTQHFTVGVRKVNSDTYETGTPLFRLARGNGVSQHIFSGGEFGTAAIALPATNWYELQVTITFVGYDEVIGTTFNAEAELYNRGADGMAPLVSPLLEGTTTITMTTEPKIHEMGRPIFYSNASRGFNHVDEFYAFIPPPPGTLLTVR